MRHHFATVCHRITRFAQKCSELHVGTNFGSRHNHQKSCPDPTRPTNFPGFLDPTHELPVMEKFEKLIVLSKKSSNDILLGNLSTNSFTLVV